MGYNEDLQNITNNLQIAKTDEERNKAKLDFIQRQMQESSATNYALANSAFMGLPDVVAKLINGDNYKKIISEREALNPINRIGAEIGGAIVSPIKGGTLLKGAGTVLKGAGNLGKTAEAIKLAENANKLNTLQKLGKAATGAGQYLAAPAQSVGQAIIKGAGAGLEQAVPRIGIKAATDGNLDAGQAGFDLGTSALLGGALGGAFKGIGGLFAPGGLKGVKNLVGEGVDESIMGTLAAMGGDSRGMRQLRSKGLGMGTDSRKLKSLDEARENLVRYGNELSLMNPIARDKKIIKEYDRISGEYKKIDKVFNEQKPDIKAIMDDPNAGGRLWEDTYQAMKEAYPDQADTVVNKFINDLNTRSTLLGKRTYLQGIMNRAQKSTDDLSEAQFMAAATLKGVLDDAVDLTLEKKGMESLRKLNQDYKALQFFGGSVLRDETKLPASSLGSPTFEKTAVNNALEGKQLPGVNTAISSLAGKMGMDALGLGKNVLLSKLAKPLQGLEQKIPDQLELPGLIKAPAKALGNQLGTKTGAIANAMAPKTEAPAREAKKEEASTVDPVTGQATTQKAPISQAYFDKLTPGLRKLYLKSGAMEQGASFEEFVNFMEKKTGGFAPRKVAGLLYTDKADKKKFLRDVERAEQLKKIDLEQSLNKSGADFIPLIGDMVGGNEHRKALQSALASMTASNSDLGDTKAAENVQGFLKKIMELPAKDRKKALFSALQNKDILDYSTLNEMGLI